jgi:hypothetical protein
MITLSYHERVSLKMSGHREAHGHRPCGTRCSPSDCPERRREGTAAQSAVHAVARKLPCKHHRATSNVAPRSAGHGRCSAAPGAFVFLPDMGEG